MNGDLASLVVNGAVSLVAVVTLVAYVQATRTHFIAKNPSFGAVLIAVNVIAATILFLTLQWMHSRPLASAIAGLSVMIAAGALFHVARTSSKGAGLGYAFDGQQSGYIVSAGPYRFIRHPFYAAYLLFWIGWSIAVWSAWTLLPTVGFVVLYTAAALREEQSFAGGALADGYQQYRDRTGLFAPRLRGL